MDRRMGKRKEGTQKEQGRRWNQKRMEEVVVVEWKGSGGASLPFWKFAALGLVLAGCAITETEGNMNFRAFEYFRKFGKHLELGECPQRELVITLPNNTRLLRQEPCMARQMGNVTDFISFISEARHLLIPSARNLMAYVGLCGGEAASYLGLLNDGDCLAVEIASRLTFSKKTMVRACYLYYQQSVDILESTDRPWNQHASGSRVGERLWEYLRNKYYVKKQSYGTLELILVQFRFRSTKETEAARKLKMASAANWMSEYMKRLEREVGKPKRVMVLTLSMGTEEQYRVERYSPKQWGSAVRDVEIREGMVNLTRQRIQSGRIRPNLNYELSPFLPQEGQSLRSSLLSWDAWEEISMLEVSLRASISTAKKAAKQCRKNKTKLCRRVRELRRKLVTLQKEMHGVRAAWSSVTVDEYQDVLRRYSSLVELYGRMTRNLARYVRKMKKEEKLRGLRKKKKEANEVPVTGRIGKVEQQKHRDWSFHQRIKQRWLRRGYRG